LHQKEMYLSETLELTFVGFVQTVMT